MRTFKKTVQIDFVQSYKKFTLQNLKSSRQSCRHLSDDLKKNDIPFSKLSDEQFKVKIFVIFLTSLVSIIIQNRCSYIKNLNL